MSSSILLAAFAFGCASAPAHVAPAPKYSGDSSARNDAPVDAAPPPSDGVAFVPTGARPAPATTPVDASKPVGVTPQKSAIRR